MLPGLLLGFRVIPVKHQNKTLQNEPPDSVSADRVKTTM